MVPNIKYPPWQPASQASSAGIVLAGVRSAIPVLALIFCFSPIFLRAAKSPAGRLAAGGFQLTICYNSRPKYEDGSFQTHRQMAALV